MKRYLFILALLFPTVVLAQTTRTVDHARLVIADLVPGAPSAMASVDLGPAPPPGGTRVIAKGEVDSRLRSAGLEPSALRMPQSIRVLGASKRISPVELGRLATPLIEKELPAGIRLTKTEPYSEVVVSPRATVRSATVPRPPRQKGQFRTTATVELVNDDVVVARIPVPILLDISEAAAKADLQRGSVVMLVIDSRSVRISTEGVVMADANVGDVANVQVKSTGRIVPAKLVSKDEAKVVDKR